jgi:hypothetical protein
VNILSCNTDLQPYPDELLYSIHARLGLHGAIVSPKYLIEVLYDDRKAAASLLYPSRLRKLADSLDSTNPDDLISKHTLFPLVAPFIPQKRRLTCIERMKSGSGLGLHLASGYAAGRLPKLSGIRFCPDCLKEQIKQHGEPYWTRIHQVMGLNVCVIHGCKLSFVPHTKTGQYRHTFLPAMSHHISTKDDADISDIDRLINKACQQLLSAIDICPPTYAQWTNYYRYLARDVGVAKGAYVDFDKVKEIVSGCWQHSWLKDYHLSISNHQSNWLHNIFRKHRKSFSYLEHIVVNAALLQDKFDITECIGFAAEQAKSLRKHDSVSSFATSLPTALLDSDKLAWERLLETQTPNISRGTSPALYTRLYRADKDWLLQINEAHKAKRIPVNNRVNWRKRDFATVRSLFGIIPRIDEDLSLPRSTKRWIMFQLNNTSTVEKFAQKLPITSMFLERYAESVSEYQIRRITHQLFTNPHSFITRRWFLLRASGLSEERMTEITRRFLAELGESLPPFGHMNFTPLHETNNAQ